MKKIGTTAALLGFAGVALGALGAHALRDRLVAAGTSAAWETAVLYHLFHALALLAVAAVSARWAGRAAVWWTAGVVAFSGSLYVLALGGPRWLGPVTPLGGAALLVGWTLAAIGFWRSSESQTQSARP